LTIKIMFDSIDYNPDFSSMIKESLLAFFLFLCMIQATHCQESTKSFRLGAAITPELSTAFFKQDPLTTYHASLGFSIQGNFYIDINPTIQLVSGLEYQFAKFTYRDYRPDFPGDDMK